MSESCELVSPFSVGDVVSVVSSGELAYDWLLLERFHAPWPTYESMGPYWQWRYLDLHTGRADVTLENAICHWKRFA